MVFVFFSFGYLKKYLLDDYEKVYFSYFLKWRFGVKLSYVGLVSRGELEYGFFDFFGGGVDVFGRRE